MTPNQERVEAFMDQIPSQLPSLYVKMPSLQVRKLRARLLLEECLETINDGLGLSVWLGDENMSSIFCVQLAMEYISFDDEKQPSLAELADGLADLEVVTLGTASAAGLDMEPIFNEVMDNNMKKLGTGTIDVNGKLVKAKDHPAPNIKTLIFQQMEQDR